MRDKKIQFQREFPCFIQCFIQRAGGTGHSHPPENCSFCALFYVFAPPPITVFAFPKEKMLIEYWFPHLNTLIFNCPGREIRLSDPMWSDGAISRRVISQIINNSFILKYFYILNIFFNEVIITTLPCFNSSQNKWFQLWWISSSFTGIFLFNLVDFSLRNI